MSKGLKKKKKQPNKSNNSNSNVVRRNVYLTESKMFNLAEIAHTNISTGAAGQRVTTVTSGALPARSVKFVSDPLETKENYGKNVTYGLLGMTNIIPQQLLIINTMRTQVMIPSYEMIVQFDSERIQATIGCNVKRKIIPLYSIKKWKEWLKRTDRPNAPNVTITIGALPALINGFAWTSTLQVVIRGKISVNQWAQPIRREPKFYGKVVPFDPDTETSVSEEDEDDK